MGSSSSLSRLDHGSNAAFYSRSANLEKMTYAGNTYSSSSSSTNPRRRKKQVSLLLPPITAGQSLNSSTVGNPCYAGIRYVAIATCASIILVFTSRGSGGTKSHGNNPIISSSSLWNSNMENLTSSSRPFQYIGNFDPSEPQPWPKEEKDWHSLHQLLVKRVEESDALPVHQVDNSDFLPQLVFYGDSITEGWNGTSFGNLPGSHRMWKGGEDETIRDVFANAFGDKSDWGTRALKPPLILGISGSRTYDFIWRVLNGEFPVSSLLKDGTHHDNGNENEFQMKKLERIYILLMGTNNLGGGMLPSPTIKGMDASVRTILQLHQEHFPDVPAAMIFNELLPRKDDFRAVKMCPPRCKDVEKLEPYQSFTPAIEKVNRALPALVYSWRKDFPNSRIILLSSLAKAETENDTSVITCGKELFDMGDVDEFDEYMPDRLHPNAKGYELWSRCLKKGLDAIMMR